MTYKLQALGLGKKKTMENPYSAKVNKRPVENTFVAILRLASKVAVKSQLSKLIIAGFLHWNSILVDKKKLLCTYFFPPIASSIHSCDLCTGNSVDLEA